MKPLLKVTAVFTRQAVILLYLTERVWERVPQRSNILQCFHWWLDEGIMNNLIAFSNDSMVRDAMLLGTALELKIILRIAAMLWKPGCALIWVSRAHYTIIKCKNKMRKDRLAAVMQRKDPRMKLNVRQQCQSSKKKKSHYLQMCYR